MRSMSLKIQWCCKVKWICAKNIWWRSCIASKNKKHHTRIKTKQLKERSELCKEAPTSVVVILYFYIINTVLLVVELSHQPKQNTLLHSATPFTQAVVHYDSSGLVLSCPDWWSVWCCVYCSRSKVHCGFTLCEYQISRYIAEWQSVYHTLQTWYCWYSLKLLSINHTYMQPYHSLFPPKKAVSVFTNTNIMHNFSKIK